MVKKVIACYIALFCGSWISSTALAQNLQWAASAGGTASDLAKSIAVDAAGNVYTVGSFQGTGDFDPGPGSSNLTSSGAEDIFICKYDSTGAFLWAKNMGAGGTDIANSVSVDPAGNPYFTGSFTGSVDFDPGVSSAVLTSTGSSDIFICKLSASGSFLWAEDIGGTANDAGNAIFVDASANIYVTGYFQGSVDFDPSAGTSTLSSVAPQDIFVAMFSTSGVLSWAKQIGMTGYNNAYDLASDVSGNLYITGVFNGVTDFDPSAAVSTLAASGADDIFVLKLDNSGNYVWADGFGGSGSDAGNTVRADALGNVYAGGYYNGTADFDPGAGTSYLTSNGNEDLFITKLDPSGNLTWVKSIGGGGSDYVNSLGTDASGDVYATGYFSGTVDFDPLSGPFILNSFSGSGDFFLLKLDSSGSFMNASATGSTGSDMSNSLFIDASDNVYITGYYSGTVDFDPGAAVSSLISVSGSDDIFVTKFHNCSVVASAGANVSICAGDNAVLTGVGSGGSAPYTYNWYDGTLNFTNATLSAGPAVNTTYTLTVTDMTGCADMTTVSITVMPSTNIRGHVTYSGGNVNSGVVVLLHSVSFLTPLDTIQYVGLSPGGNYSFSPVDHQNCLVLVYPDTLLYPTLVPTYSGGAFLWDSALVIVHDCTVADTMDIVMAEESTATGPGAAQGSVLEDYGFIRMPGDPIPGVDVKLGRNPGGQFVTNTQTDASGTYSFTGLAYNLPGENYRVYVDIPGMGRDSSYAFVVDSTNTTFNNLNYTVDSTIVHYVPLMPTGVHPATTVQDKFIIYPNPSKGNATIEYSFNVNSEINLSIYNVLGVKISELLNTEQTAGTYKISMRDKISSPGIYFVALVTNGKTYTHKIIITE